jgi:GNAT superfamily N-acetyltransferase
METQMEMTLNLTRDIKRFARENSDQIQFQTIDSIESLEEVLSNIDEELFITDRVSLDPALGIGFAHKRYVNWIRDGFLSGDALIIEAKKKTNRIGFYYITKRKDKAINAVLASVYKNFRRKGIGMSYLEEISVWLAENGYKKINTRVSSNNLEALRANLAVGFKIKKTYYILRKITK